VMDQRCGTQAHALRDVYKVVAFSLPAQILITDRCLDRIQGAAPCRRLGGMRMCAGTAGWVVEPDEGEPSSRLLER
jgi:hypothetical protein